MEDDKETNLQNDFYKEKYSSFYKRKYYDHMFEQYKLYVETAEEVSRKRQQSNNFFIGINTALIGVLGYFNYYRTSDNTDGNWILALFLLGIVLSFVWRRMIKSYRQLNTAKYKVIHDIEKEMPLNLFSREWYKLKSIEYVPFTKIEECIPFICGAFYVSFLIQFIIKFVCVDLMPFIK